MGSDVVKLTADEALQNSSTIMQNVLYLVFLLIVYKKQAIKAIKAIGVLDEEIGTSQLTIGKK